MKGKILVVNPRIDDRQKKQIADVAGKYGRESEFYYTVDEALPNLEGAEIVYGSHPALIKNAPDIKWFCSGSAGIDHYVRAGAFDGRDIILTNSSGSFGRSISEYIIMMSLYMMRRMQEYRILSDQNIWPTDYLDIRNLSDSRILVLGTGDLGRTFAKRISGFEPVSLVGVSKSGRAIDEFNRVYTIDALREAVFAEEGADLSPEGKEMAGIIGETDLLVMCLPGTPDTEGILSTEFIKKLPNTAFVVNVGRGSNVDEEALSLALEEDRLAGAALDVLRQEPLPEDSKLWNVKNLLLTPHISGQETTAWTRDNCYNMFCEDLENYFEGRPLVHLANPNAGY